MMRAKKHLGQHFLHDPHQIERIVRALDAPAGSRVLEIGPGPATLTEPLHARGYRLTAVDPDPDMIAFLQQRHFDPPIDLIRADFMEIPLARVIEPPTYVISNLPYNVSVPITAKLLEAAVSIPTMVMMYQKEVAERIRARPGTGAYGPITVSVAQFYTIDLHFDVKPGSFRPPPKVMSQVIRLRRRERPIIPPDRLARLTALVRFLFTHRRKTLGARLKSWRQDWTNVETLLESLKNCGLDSRARPENLSPADYAAWLNSIEGGSWAQEIDLA